MMMVLNVVV